MSILHEEILMKTTNVTACFLLVAVVVLLSAGRTQEPLASRYSFLALLRAGDYVGLTRNTFPYRLDLYSPEELEEIESGGNVPAALYEVTSVGADYVGLSYVEDTRQVQKTRKELCLPAWSIATLSRSSLDKGR
jgi:hypothetical protein